MSSADAQFWQNADHDKKQLAQHYEQNITLTHPNRAKGACRHICGRCPWAATTVTYYEYRGEAL